ncbi:MAG: nickel pincer cofactor biosynthesis protein LarC [Treponema sp.]|nr:nickel pincer cofactor biosynthesis protein LarC [Treponema sp.]
MKTLHFDCFAGISGDMVLGAFVDLGVDPVLLRTELSKLGLGGWALEFMREDRCGITGIHAVVNLEGRSSHIAQDDAGHFHPHDHHSHNHDHHEQDHGSGHSHHSWKDIRRLIENSGISGGAKKRALAIFTLIAGAESQVHGVPPEDIAFHEVGAMDSIIDIVGAAICLDLLKPDRVTCGEVELGGGMVACEHGVLPVPAPATVILCRGMPVKTGGFDREMTTPTGAAILAASVDEFIAGGSFTELRTGYGIGTRKLDKPNLLRVSWREERNIPAPVLEGGILAEELVLIEANVDDMSGEALGFLMESLFEEGALDVTLSPCVMKKSRPGTVVSVLCPPGKLGVLRRVMFRRSSTIGFREIAVRRLSLKREEGLTADGGGRTKTVFWGDKPLRSKIEYEDRARVAREQGVSLEDAERIIRDGKIS